MTKSDPAKYADYTKSNQGKLSPQNAEKARTERHPEDTTPAPQPLADAKREVKREVRKPSED